MSDTTEHGSDRWAGPSGAAYFVPEDEAAREKARARNAERFSRYMDHAVAAWGTLLSTTALEGWSVEYTGGGALTLMFHRPGRGYSILVGPFGPDPDPPVEEASVGVCTPVYTDADREPEVWTDGRVGFLDPDPGRTREDFVRWLVDGVTLIDGDPFGGRNEA